MDAADEAEAEAVLTILTVFILVYITADFSLIN